MDKDNFTAIRTFALNYGGISTEKYMAFCPSHKRTSVAKPNLAVSSVGCPERLLYQEPKNIPPEMSIEEALILLRLSCFSFY